MAIRYTVELTDAERHALQDLLSKNNASRSKIINAFILLKSDAAWGWTNMEIATAYEVSPKKVERVKRRFVEEGFEEALQRRPVTNAHRCKITGEEEAHLIALCCSAPPAGHKTWTLRLLADKIVELAIVESISHETIRKALKKMPLNPGKSKNGASRRRKMPLLSATWKKS